MILQSPQNPSFSWHDVHMIQNTQNNHERVFLLYETILPILWEMITSKSGMGNNLLADDKVCICTTVAPSTYTLPCACSADAPITSQVNPYASKNHTASLEHC